MSKSNHNRIRLTLSTLLMGAFLVTALAFPHKASIGGEYVEAEDSLVRAKVEEWQGLKFGLMMHWGTYSQWELQNPGRDILWLDGGWVSKKTKEDIIYAYTQQLKDSENGYVKFRTVNEDIRIDELVEKARKLQPELIVVDRDVPGKNQNYLTPENRIPEEPLHAPWESVLVTSNSGWSYAENVHYISGFQGIKLLVEIVAKGGNLLLNVPPSPEGELDQGVYDLLNSFGKWMEINKEGELILFLLALFRIRFILGLFLGAPFAR